MGRTIVTALTSIFGRCGASLDPVIINVPADFPTTVEANRDQGRSYIAGQDVTDNDPTKTNTGQSFLAGDVFIWDGVSAYVIIQTDMIWIETNGDVITINPKDVNLQANGLKDTDVTTAVKLGNATNTSLNTADKSLLGSSNEIKLEKETAIGTCLRYGGKPSINGGDATKYDLSAGSARFVDNYTDPENPSLSIVVTWTQQTAIPVTGINTQFTTFVGVNSSGIFLQSAAPFASYEERYIVPLGILVHSNLTTLNLANSFTNWGKDILLTLSDLMYTLGPRLTNGGIKYSANGANLNLDRSSGTMVGMGLNYGNDKQDPNILGINQSLALSFFTLYRNTPIATITPTSTVPNTQYDPNGDGTLVSIPVNYFVTHRIYYDPSSDTTILQYAQFAYDSLKKASTSWEQEAFAKDVVIGGVQLRTVLIIQTGCTNLEDPDCTKFANMGLFGDRNLQQIENFSRFADPVEIIDGMSTQRPSITYINDGGTIYADVESVDATDITYAFQQREFTLNCTTGAGVSGRARVALTAGASFDAPVQNYVYVTRNGEVAQLNASTTFPTGQFGWVCDVLVPDATTFDSIKVYSAQRYSDNKSHDGRGALSYEREKIRSLGVSYESGVVPTVTITDLTPDTLDFSTTAGEVYQLHKHTMPALNSAVDGIFVINHPTTPWLYTTHIDTIQVDTNGDTLNNKSFNFVFVGIKSTADSTDYSHLGLLLPTGSYNYLSLSSALADEDNTSVTSVPSSIKKTAFLICRVTLKYKNGVWNNVTADETAITFFDLRGNPLGAQTGGAGTPSVTAFSDSIFSVFNNADVTKELKFDASLIGTGQTRTLTIPNASGTIALLDSPVFTTQITTPKIYNAGNIAIDAYNAAANSLVTIENSDATYSTELIVGGAISSFGNYISGYYLKLRDDQGIFGNDLSIYYNETSTADRTFNLVLGDADRTLTFAGNATVSQDYRAVASPTFAGLTLSNLNTVNGIVQTNGSGVLSSSTTISPATINAFSLGGKLTAGANEIEGSNFDINGGTIDISGNGALTLSGSGIQRIVVVSSTDQAGISLKSNTGNEWVISSPKDSSNLAFYYGSQWATFSTSGVFDLVSSLKVNTINEHTSNAGVTIDGVLIKDDYVDNGLLRMTGAALGVQGAGTDLTLIPKGVGIVKTVRNSGTTAASYLAQNDGGDAYFIADRAAGNDVVGMHLKTNNVLKWQIGTDGSVGNEQLEFRGAGLWFYMGQTSGVTFFPAVYSDTVTSSRDLEIQSNGQIGYVSSILESKTNIDSFDSSFIYNLQPKKCNMRLKNEEGSYINEHQPETEYVLLAEEVEPVAKDFVFYDIVDNKEEIRGVYYKKFITPMIQCIQEQKTKIDTLEARIEALENFINIT